MPITSIETDPVTLTMTIVGDYPVSRQRLWNAYADARQIERFWGPVGWPATFSRHDFIPGGMSNYQMDGPDGEVSAGYFDFIAVKEPEFFEVRDGFADEQGEPNPDMPSMRMLFQFDETESGSRVVMTTYFNSSAELEQLIEMGMEEGTRSAMSQIDEVLAE